MSNYPRVIIAGTHSGVGKTTLTMGLLLSIKEKGLSIQAYKVGPDYIDTGFHTNLSNRPCRNLDSYLLEEEVIKELFDRQSRQVMFSLIEGVMGVYDGAGASGVGSTAHIAKILNCPAILVIDAGKMAQSAAAVALGYQLFDRDFPLAGFILNRIGSQAHFDLTKQAIEERTNIPVLGYLSKNPSLNIPERHLGLTPVQEINSLSHEKLRGSIEENIDVEAVIKIGQSAGPFPSFQKRIFSVKAKTKEVCLAVAFDECFHFYYADNLDILESLGVRLLYFSPLKDTTIPDEAAGLYIGGGFPELFTHKLSQNKSLQEDITIKSEQGMPIYAECGGLMYLMKELQNKEGEVFSLVGLFPGRVKMGKRLQTFGYHSIKTIKENILGKKDETGKGHVFHWSYIEDMPEKYPMALKVEKKGGIYFDGYVRKNTLACYVHLHFGTHLSWAERFVQQCLNYQKGKS